MAAQDPVIKLRSGLTTGWSWRRAGGPGRLGGYARVPQLTRGVMRTDCIRADAGV